MVKRTRSSAKKVGSSKKKTKNIEVTVESLIKTNKFLSIITTEYGEKVQCSLTKQEMPVRIDVVQKHLNSKKLERTRKGWYDDNWVEKYAPYIIPHISKEKRLFCKITKQILNSNPEVVEKHVQGKRYKRLKKEYDENQKKNYDDQKPIGQNQA